MGDTWIVDLRDFLKADGTFAPDSGRALALAQHFAAIVREITADIGDEVSFPKVACRRRPNHRRCPGRIESALDADWAIVWQCPICGDCGRIDGWEGTFWDLSEASRRQ